MVLDLEGQYLEAWAKDKPGQPEQLPALMAASQLDFTGKPAAAWRYRMRDPTMGRLWALLAEGAAVHLVGMDGWSSEWREKRQSLAPPVSR